MKFVHMISAVHFVSEVAYGSEVSPYGEVLDKPKVLLRTIQKVSAQQRSFIPSVVEESL